MMNKMILVFIALLLIICGIADPQVFYHHETYQQDHVYVINMEEK